MNDFINRAHQLFNDGNRRMDAGDNKGAEDHFRLALMLLPDFPEALANLGLMRERAGAVAEAEQHYRRAILLQPGNVGIQLNLGTLLLNQKRLDEAEAVNRRALLVAPQSPNAWSALGVLLVCLQQDEEAEQCYRQSLRLDPAFSRARFNLSYLMLRQGRFDEGWAYMEARDHYAHLERHFTCPRWRGEPVAGKTFVIGVEGGHGDMIQFGRYARLLKERGAGRITLIAHPAAAALMARVDGIDEVLEMDRHIAVDGWDYWTPPMSFPYWFGTREETIPVAIPYLSAPPELVDKWKARLPAGPKVGLSWKGNPKFENDSERSLPSLDALAPLASITGVHFVSLQKGAGQDQALTPPAGMDLLPFGAELADFADTAALVANMDLVISVDTAVAHLAGALGKPTWTLLSDFKADWRWLTGRADTPWYPGMRLFRQPRGGGWDAPVAAVAAALRQWAAAR